MHDVFHRPQHPYTQALLRCDPARIEQATRELPTIAGEVPSLALPPGAACSARAARMRSSAASSRRRSIPTAPGHAARCHLLDHG